MKKIVVLVKEVPDPKGLGVSRSKAKIFEREKRIINPNDRFALELAFRQKDSGKATVTALSVGGENTSTTLKEIYALGADEVVLLKFDSELDSNQIATAIADYLKDYKFDVILAGTYSTVHEIGEVPQRVAAALNIKFFSNVENLEIDENEVYLDGKSFSLPLLATVKPESNRPRRPSAKMILLSRKKQIKIIEPEVELPEPAKIQVSTELP